MSNPRFSAPELTPEQIAKAREGGRPWPRNRDIDWNVSETDPEQEKPR